MARHLDFEELERLREALPPAPRDEGTLEVIYRRPRKGEREQLAEGELSLEQGLVGDRWVLDADRELERQLTLMQRVHAELVADGPERRALCGDNLLVDLELAEDNVPPGTRLAIGDAELEVTEVPHLGCSQFRGHFGEGALKWVNYKPTRALKLRGVNARILRGGTVRVGDPIRVHRP